MENGILSIKIKPMEKVDVDNVIAIEEKAYGPHHWSKDSFLSELSNDLARYFCAFNENGDLIGYCGCWQILEESHITNIAVHPDFRGDCACQCRPLRKPALHVRQSEYLRLALCAGTDRQYRAEYHPDPASGLERRRNCHGLRYGHRSSHPLLCGL